MAWTLHEGDCLEVMTTLPDRSIDMILCDLPYGTTACKWDVIIPFKPLWKEYERLIKDKGAIVLTADQPFTSLLVASNLKLFRYEIVWEKEKGTDVLNCNRKILDAHENIPVFYKKLPTYNPQFKEGKPYTRKQGRCTLGDHLKDKNIRPTNKLSDGRRFPTSVVKVSRDMHRDKVSHHPTQKPVALFEYLIKTYTNPGETVLDSCAGSGTTGEAAERTGRNSILIEKEPKYCAVIRNRLNNLQIQQAIL